MIVAEDRCAAPGLVAEILSPDDSGLRIAHRVLHRRFASFAKECVVGLPGLDGPVLGKLQQNEGVTHYARAGIEHILTAIDELRLNPSHPQLAATAQAIRETKTLRIYRWEAWNDTREAIATTAENSKPALDNLARVRDRLRRTGRTRHIRIGSRTFLVKGLEYDHVFIADLTKTRDPRNLHVALSRACKSVVVVEKPRILLSDGS